MWSKRLFNTEQADNNEEPVVSPKEDELPRIESDSESDFIEDEVECIKKPTHRVNYRDKDDVPFFGWNETDDRVNYADKIIKRFRLKKLKSPNGNSNIYYFDNVLYFIWQYSKIDANQDTFIRPTEEVCKMLRVNNGIRFEPFLAQPEEFW